MRDFGGDLLAMCNRCAEDEARLALARLLDDLAASRRDQTILAHCLFDILGHELACADVQMVKVGVCNTGLRSDLRDVPGINEILHVGLVGNLVEEVLGLADESTLCAERRRRPADHAEIRIPRLGRRQEGLVPTLAVGRNHMHLVHHNKVERLELVDLVVDRLNARHDDRLGRVPPVESGGIHTHGQVGADVRDLLGVLVDQLLHVRQDQHTPMPEIDRIGGNGGDAQRLAASGRNDDARIGLLRAQEVVKSRLRITLVITQFKHGSVP